MVALVHRGDVADFAGRLGVTTVGSCRRACRLTLASAAAARRGRRLPLAFACFLLAYIESVSAARTLAQKHGDEINPRQELLALGAANLAAAFGQGFPVAGGLSQSAVNDKAGAKTPLALVFASAHAGACLLFLTDLLRNLPTVVLAAIVLVAVKGLIDFPACGGCGRSAGSSSGSRWWRWSACCCWAS